MYLSNVISFSFRETLAAIRQQPLYRHPSAFLWQRCLSVRNPPVVIVWEPRSSVASSSGRLTRKDASTMAR